ncbi:hypothetical protein HDU93_000493, partial [Gonapodya sp. JEL0774]
VQPFIAFGKRLQQPSAKHPHGHRVRLATHETFRKFVTDSGLEFYPLAGDPAELMAYMVKNPGLLPGYESILAGDIGRKRSSMREILSTMYKACIESEPGVPPFTADVIISNPVTFGHIHIAEKMGIPLHIFFTMPWSSTSAFPHPLANIEYSNAPSSLTNRLSYEVTELMTWEGLGDIINEFRHRDLGLRGLPLSMAPFLVKNLKVPHSYTWSPNLIPKPDDWGPHIDVVGFYFLPGSGETNYQPPDSLTAFLAGTDKPIVYIGFGSIVVDDPDQLTSKIFEAVEKAGVRALVSKGWGGLGGNDLAVPDNVYMIGACPHDWLFTKVAAVIHHGGAGTTATGLMCGRPTSIIPFFGDQPFVARMGVGPPPILFKSLTADNLASAIQFCLQPQVVQAAALLGVEMRKEDGVGRGVESFHKHLPLEKMICNIDRNLLAEWYCEEANILLSTAILRILLEEGRLKKKKVHRYINTHWDTEGFATNLVSGIVGGTKSVAVDATRAVTNVIVQTSNSLTKAGQTSSAGGKVWEVVKGVGKGLGGTVYYPLKGAGRFMEKMSDGMKNSQLLLEGRTPQKSAPVYGVGTGLLEGSKSFALSMAEGLTGILVKPIVGAVHGGVSGFMLGFAAGTVSFITMPIAGSLDLVVMTGKGFSRSAHRMVSGTPIVAGVATGDGFFPPTDSKGRGQDEDWGEYRKTSLRRDEVLKLFDEFLMWRNREERVTPSQSEGSSQREN